MANQKDQAMEPRITADAQLEKLTAAVSNLTNAIPADAFDGLRDLVMLVQEGISQLRANETTLLDVEQQVELLQEFLLRSEQHLKQRATMEHIDDLLAASLELCVSASLTQEDQQMMHEMLMSDLTSANNSSEPEQPDKTQVIDELEAYKACTEQFIEGATQQNLTGVQDVLLLLQEWLTEKVQRIQALSESLAVEEQLVINQILEAVDGYLVSSSDPALLVDQMLSDVVKLGRSCQLPSADVEALTEVLISERISVGDEQSSNAKPDTDQVEPAEEERNLSENLVESYGSAIVLPADVQALLELLVMAHQQLDLSINAVLVNLSDQAADDANRNQSIEALQEDLQRFATTAAAAEWAGLQSSCDHVQQNVNTLASAAKCWTDEQCFAISQWSAAINSYLQAPLDPGAMQAVLLSHLTSEWPDAMKEEQAANLLSGMQNLLTKDTDDPANFRQQEATDQDVSLALPEDVIPELLDSLLQELPGHAAEFSDTIAELVNGGTLNDVTKAQRIAHTVKGAGNTVGIVGIANLTHHLEDILTALAHAQKLPNNRIASTLMRSSDCLAEMSDALANGSSAPSDAKEVLQEVLDLARQIDQQGIPEHDQEAVKPSATTKNNVEEPSANQPTSNEAVEEQMIRLPVSVVDNLLQLANEVMLVNSQLRERFRSATDEAKYMQGQLDQLLGLGLELEDLINVRNIDLLSKQGEADINGDFDALEMDQYNELHTCSRRLYEVATDTREIGKSYANSLRKMDDMAIEQGILNDTSREKLLAMRLVSSKSIVPRLQRCVRQASRLTGKQIELSIAGQDLQIDRDLLNGMLDPLMHLLRNAVDHGIESGEQRVAAGKSSTGSIALSFKHDKNFISIECRDDGAGLNLQAIRSKAIERGLISASTDLTEDELKQLIFQPNFSTRSQVTQVSGRGVGMDAVMNAVRGLGGSLHIDSQQNLGSVFHIQLPQSLVHYHAIVVKVGTQSIAVAERAVSQILHTGSGVVNGSGDDLTFEFDDEVYPVKTIESLLTRVKPGNNLSLQQRTVMLIEQRDTKYAVLVESIVGVKELVVKGFDAFVPKLHGIIGASILDDGSIAPVIDMHELLEEPNRWSDRDLTQELLEQSAQDLPCALVVDDSLSARRSLEHFMSDLGFEVIAARDGLEATEKVTERVPDIIVTDLEMPRLNGIELTEFVRSRSASETVPVIMITSRSTAKHRELAEAKGVNAYLNKPFAEDTLAEAVMNLFRPKNEQRDVA